ncbi:unnamed protein product [Rotaria sp. Silwood2]|nr:unnamed protein product [Rotaria sp. Silwood2]
MQTHYMARLASTQNFNTIRRTLSGRTLPGLRKLIQSNSLQTTTSLRSSYIFRYASTNSSNDEQNRNEEKKKNMTNLMYIVGGLTGVVAIYSIFQNRKSSKGKKQAVTEYDEKHKQSQDSINKIDDSNKTLVEKVHDLQQRKLLAEEEDSDKITEMNKNDLTPNIPNFAQYLIIGGGATAMSAFKSIRANDPTAKVLVISSEKYLPYMRPPLSKDIWYTDDDELIQKHSFKQWNGKEKSLYFNDKEFYTDVKILNDQENGGVAVVLGRKVVDLDLKNSVAKLDNGWEISFEKCLIATGGQPQTLRIFKTASSYLKIMLNDEKLNPIEYHNGNLSDEYATKFSSQKLFLSNTENIFHNASTNMNLNNNVIEDLDFYLINNNDHHSDSSHTSSPLSQQQHPQFYFILNALPSSSRINEETTTYLNQGQPYEIKFQIKKNKTQHLTRPSMDYSFSTTYRSILRLCFWDKILQNQEYELMQKWVNAYQSSSLFDIDMNLTYGILSIIRSKQIPNAIEIVWDASTTTSLFIRFKCTSTDFAQKRHGGEKGILLRIQIDTYENYVDDIRHLYSCYCKLQLFRLKGAQRKNKADKMRIEKLNFHQRRQYQTTLEYTILQQCSISSLYTLNLLSLSYPPDDLFDVCTTPIIQENLLIEKKESDDLENNDQNHYQNNSPEGLSSMLSSSPSNMKHNSTEFHNLQSRIETKITIQSSNEQVLNWLNNNNFSSVINRFQHYKGVDILRLSKNDIRQICNDDNAISIRLYNQLNETLIQPLKILYITLTNNDIYSTIYLHTLTCHELLEKLFELIQQPKQEIFNIILELNKIKIRIDKDNVVKYSLPNESRFYLKIYPYEFNLCLLNISIDDFFTLRKIVDSGADVAIVGGGFLGSELACALAYRSKQNGKNGKPSGKITQLMHEAGSISKVLPEYLSKWTSERVREEGAEVVTNVELVGTSIQEGKVTLSYIDPNEPKKTSYVTADHIIVAVGIEPNTDFAKSAGLEIDPNHGGFLVNAELQARHNIWVAGDAASFYDIKLGRRRVEHYDHAIVSGKLAGENMTGAHKPYWHQSMFWSDLGPNIGFEAIGLTDSELQTVAVYAKGKPDDEIQKEDSEGNREQQDIALTSNANALKHNIPKTTAENKDDYNKGVVFYLKENKVVGIVLWNVFNRIPIARKIIKDQEVITNFQELAKLFNIHQD